MAVRGSTAQWLFVRGFILFDNLIRSKKGPATWGKRIPSYQRRPSSLQQGKQTCTFPMNLHGVGRSARPTFKWALIAHREMGKTQKGHCELSFGRNVLVLDKLLVLDKRACIRQMTPQIHLTLDPPSDARKRAWINVVTEHLLGSYDDLRNCSIKTIKLQLHRLKLGKLNHFYSTQFCIVLKNRVNVRSVCLVDWLGDLHTWCIATRLRWLEDVWCRLSFEWKSANLQVVSFRKASEPYRL